MTKRIGLLLGRRKSPNIDILGVNITEMLSTCFEVETITANSIRRPDSLNCWSYNSQNPTTKVTSLFELTRQCRTYIHERDPDLIVQITDPTLHSIAVGLATSGTDTTPVYRYSGHRFGEHEVESEPIKKAMVYGYNVTGNRLGLNLCEWYITLGRFGKQVLEHYGCQGDRIHVLPQPVDVARFQDPIDSLTLSLDVQERIDDAEVTALTIGRLSWRKGADTLLESVQEVDRRGEHVHFLVVGDGPYRSHLATYDCVTASGRVPHEEIPGYFTHADVLVHPSRIEGLPNVVLEAIASDTPVLARPVGELSEMLERPITDSADLTRRLIERSFERVGDPSEYSIEALREDYIRAFNQMTS